MVNNVMLVLIVVGNSLNFLIIISDEMKVLIDKLLLERLSLRAIVRIVSHKWLQKYINDKYENIPHEINVTPKSKGRLTIECDELWSFVFDKQTMGMACHRPLYS